MNKRFFDHIRSTLAINPDPHSAAVSPNRLASFGYALAGLLHMFRYAKNVRIQGLAAVIVFALAAWLDFGRVEWSILVIMVSLNFLAEFLNAAVEAAVNLATTEYHPMAQVAKDVAAGAALLMALTSVLVGLLLFAEPLWNKLHE